MKIFINPGHGGADPGAVGNGLVEAEVALAIGERAAKYLQAVGYQTKVFQFDGLHTICDDANAWGADFFISLHCNAAASPRATGTETFFWNGGHGRKLAAKIQNQVADSLGTVNRGTKTANFTVLAYTDMPAVLVETAFISNPQDAELLRDRQDDFARAIARGVTDFLKDAKPLPDVVDTNSGAGKLSEHFDASEFACHHCGALKTNPRLLALLEQLRADIGGLPLHINSGYRCPAHNQNVGGVPNSQHTLGTAADVAVPAGLNFRQFAWYVDRLPFDGIGYYPDANFIHVDVRNGGVASKICWEG